ncbi:bacterioferritin-associated ferredoxin [Methylocella sp.]|uniref:(2Fe-2S)-binding protein n=1 Tax=Methylocella sp. TaxID=1978226 RepID=UPI0035AED014
MIVCSCNVLSDAKIKSAIDAHDAMGPRTPTALYKCLGCSPNCGRCLRTIRKIMDDAVNGHGNVRPGGHGATESVAGCAGLEGCGHAHEACPRRAEIPAFVAAQLEAAYPAE